MQNIHDTHMKVSYDQNHPIHIYVEDCINQSQNFVMDRTLTISMNRFNRYDMSLCFLKNQIYKTKESFLDSLENHYFLKNTNISFDHIDDLYTTIENDKQYLTKQFNPLVIDVIETLIKSYERIINCSNSFVSLCQWIYYLYDELKNIKALKDHGNMEDDKKNKYIGTLYFLGLHEWFHLLVIEVLYCSIDKKTNNVCTIIWGEENMIELENLMDLSINEILTYLDCEYSSHSTLYMIDQNNILIYNPDDCDDPFFETKKDKLCKILSKKYLLIRSIQSIQSVTDDQYCVFHCIDFVLRLVNATNASTSGYSEKTLKIFMKYIDDVNKITKKSDIHTFIKDLLLKSSLHCLLKKNVF